ncbi:MAG TPA: glycine zipper 2TM domain-containing protein [Telluria sp.]
MNATRIVTAAVVAASALLTGCATDPYYGNTANNGYDSRYDSRYDTRHDSRYDGRRNDAVAMGYGTIDSIQVVRGDARTTGSGAVVGGLVGALVGNQIGSGNGRTAATVAGGVAGAAIGNNVERNRNDDGREMYQINIRLDNGEYRSVMQDSVYDLRVGTRVRLAEGRVYRY